MPVVSDPGNVLVNMLVENNLEYTVIPGASACLSALVLSGLDASRFTFIGFLPEKKSDREDLLSKYAQNEETLIFYSAPHDVVKDVQTLFACLGDRKAVAVREITKMHESAVRFNLKDGYPNEPKGEFVIVVEGASKPDFTTLTEKEHIEKYLSEGMDKKEALKRVAKERGVSKSSLYKYTIE
jgi:16S rRNA (cytidine1402-2'-O)-methyltransferase